MKDFDWNEFRSEKFVVHCNTKDKALDFLKRCEDQKIKWSTEHRATKFNYWYIANKDTTYCIEYDGLVASNVQLDRKDGCKIVKWEIKN